MEACDVGVQSWRYRQCWQVGGGKNGIANDSLFHVMYVDLNNLTTSRSLIDCSVLIQADLPTFWTATGNLFKKRCCAKQRLLEAKLHVSEGTKMGCI